MSIETVERLLGTVEDVMQRRVVVVACDQSLGSAARELERAGVSGAPVTEGGRVVGVVTLRDLFQAAGVSPATVATTGPWHRYEHLMARATGTVADAMSRHVVTIRPEASVASAAAAMRAHGVNRIPVVDETGALRGIVARDDVVEAVARLAGRWEADVRRPDPQAGSEACPDA